MILTGVYVYLTYRLLKEAQSSRDPNVFVDLEFPHRHDLSVTIGNSGPTAARNLRFIVHDTVPWTRFGHRDGLKSLDVFTHGIAYLPPRRTLKFWAGSPDWKKINESGGRLSIRLMFDDELGKQHEREVAVDLKHYSQVAPDSFKDPIQILAETLERALDRPKTQDAFTTGVLRRATKACPACGEQVLQRAKKCKHCLEPIEDQRPTGDALAADRPTASAPSKSPDPAGSGIAGVDERDKAGSH